MLMSGNPQLTLCEDEGCHSDRFYTMISNHGQKRSIKNAIILHKEQRSGVSFFSVSNVYRLCPEIYTYGHTTSNLSF